MTLSEFLGNDKMQKISRVVLAIFSLYLAYQIIRIVVGGSWEVEQVILAFVMLNAGLTYSLSNKLAKVQVELNHLQSDFKNHLQKQPA